MAWVIDGAHSQIEFSVKHMMITTVRGRFGGFSGTIHINEQNPERSTAEGIIETATLDTRNEARDAHLRSPDFFAVEQYPHMSFRSTRVELVDERRFRVYGDLTIRDATSPIIFEAVNEGRGKDPWGGQRWAFSAEATINRKDWGLNWNVALETGGWLVGEQVRISIDLQLVEVVAQAQRDEAVVA